MADVVSTSSDPRLGAIRLAWWRERLEELDERGSAAAEPRLQAVAAELLPRGVGGAELSQLEDAWLPLLEPFPWAAPQSDGLKLRGRLLFRIGARLLGGASQVADLAGELWSLIDGAQHCSDPASRDHLLASARAFRVQQKVPANLRPLTIIAAVAVANTENPSSGLVRGIAATKHRLSGRIPQL